MVTSLTPFFIISAHSSFAWSVHHTIRCIVCIYLQVFLTFFAFYHIRTAYPLLIKLQSLQYSLPDRKKYKTLLSNVNGTPSIRISGYSSIFCPVSLPCKDHITRWINTGKNMQVSGSFQKNVSVINEHNSFKISSSINRFLKALIKYICICTWLRI